MQRSVYAIGEALIDFIPGEKGVGLLDVETFYKRAGGAPANVASVVAKLGGRSFFVGQVGADAFGAFLERELVKVGVNTQYLYKTTKANTALAFVSLKADGDRDFSFYRNPSADLLLEPEQVLPIEVTAGDVLHFCSVDLVDYPVKQAHRALIEKFKRHGGIVSFDVNLRLNLWESEEACIQTVREFLPVADVLKFSEEEVLLVSGKTNYAEGVQWLLDETNALLIITKGGAGADIHQAGEVLQIAGHKVEVVDTTGAGDAFIGSFLYALTKVEEGLSQLTLAQINDMLSYSNAVAALVTAKSGAIEAIPTKEEVVALLNTHKS